MRKNQLQMTIPFLMFEDIDGSCNELKENSKPESYHIQRSNSGCPNDV